LWRNGAQRQIVEAKHDAVTCTAFQLDLEALSNESSDLSDALWAAVADLVSCDQARQPQGVEHHKASHSKSVAQRAAFALLEGYLTGDVLPCTQTGASRKEVCEAGAANGKDLLIAANLHQNASLMPHFVLQILQTLAVFGSRVRFVSIYESGSKDETPCWLEALAQLLSIMHVPHQVVTGGVGKKPHEGRIQFLSKMRCALAVADAAPHCNCMMCQLFLLPSRAIVSNAGMPASHSHFTAALLATAHHQYCSVQEQGIGSVVVQCAICLVRWQARTDTSRQSGVWCAAECLLWRALGCCT
jgi:Cryptococcal mannosyltransferase 1